MSNTCKYWDCGWCYALDNVETNADSQSACVNPFICPYLVRTASFTLREHAESWYDEKLAEGKKPQLWKEETTTTQEDIL